MPTDAAAELRMLRAKAYGPAGGLSGEELARLQELEGWDAPAADASTGSAAGSAEASVPEPEVSVPEPGVSVPETGASVPEPVEGRPRRWPALALTGAALLAIGFGVGWGIWGWDSEATALAASHADTLGELEAQQLYDPGTITPLAEQYGVVIWRADRSDGAELCVIITSPKIEKNPQNGCVTAEQMADSAWPNAISTVPDGEERAGQQLIAGLIPVASGELVPYVQVWDPDRAGWESQYTENELAQLHSLESAGYDGATLSILGYDSDHIIWSTWESGVLCIVASIDDGFSEACAEDSESTISIDVRVDGFPTRYVVTQSDRRSPQLAIYKGADTDYYFGNSDEPQFDDFFTDGSSIDDKTGQ